MKHRWLVLAAASLVLGAGCYKTPKPNCTFSCGAGGECPTDYGCGPDNVCHLMSGGSLAPCDHPFDDAAVADAPAADAPVADAPAADGHPDGMPDGMPDSMPDANTCPALAIMDDGTQAAGRQDLVISLVQPASGAKIELYNTTGADIDLSTKAYQLVSGATTQALTTGTVKTHGYFSVTSTFGDLTGGGEMVLYDSATHNPGNIDDFICWDTDAGSQAKTDAIAQTKWNAAGTCVAAPTGTAVERKNNVTGVNATDYDPTSTRAPRTCP
jgi:hypothetical protein